MDRLILASVELLRLEEGEGPSLRLVGELDASNAPHVTARLQDRLRRVGELTLDTRDLNFMDAQGIRMLMKLGKEATERGTPVMVVNCSRAVSRLLEVAVPAGIPGVEIIPAKD
jgi:anti-anti-sigma factor